MRYRIGRSLQVLGMLILPFAIVSELEEKIRLWQSLAMAGFGTLVFYIGFVIQHRE
jgi:hypothetical protein